MCPGGAERARAFLLIATLLPCCTSAAQVEEEEQRACTVIRFQWGHRRIRQERHYGEKERGVTWQHEPTVVRAPPANCHFVSSCHISRKLQHLVSSATERWWCSNAEVDSEGGEVLGTGAGEEMRGSLGCHLARSVTMSCHPMMHLLTHTLPNPALLHFTLELQPMHHSVTRFHKYLHGGRFPDIRIPATRGGGSERRREMHGDKSDDPWPVVISDPTQPPKKIPENQQSS